MKSKKYISDIIKWADVEEGALHPFVPVLLANFGDMVYEDKIPNMREHIYSIINCVEELRALSQEELGKIDPRAVQQIMVLKNELDKKRCAYIRLINVS